ncbi:GNAT superfamily N-acetyltransferase [Geodermatophilus bullaregiensis]|nr:GNAT superfamily N-acetyltransferase [Geodermatophilus bullaregiensis]
MRADERVREAWTTLATPGRTVLLAELGGRPVGTADVTVVANAARGGRPYLLVEKVVVDRAHRRAGVGRALLAAARTHGEAAGCYPLQVSADDPAASASYEAAGLRHTARTYERHLDGAELPLASPGPPYPPPLRPAGPRPSGTRQDPSTPLAVRH